MFIHLHYLVGYHPPSKGIYNSVLDLFFSFFEVKMFETVQNYVLWTLKCEAVNWLVNGMVNGSFY